MSYDLPLSKQNSINKGRVIDKILSADSMNNSVSIHSIKKKASFLKENRNRLLFESPSSKTISNHSAVNFNKLEKVGQLLSFELILINYREVMHQLVSKIIVKEQSEIVQRV